MLLSEAARSDSIKMQTCVFDSCTYISFKQATTPQGKTALITPRVLCHFTAMKSLLVLQSPTGPHCRLILKRCLRTERNFGGRMAAFLCRCCKQVRKPCRGFKPQGSLTSFFSVEQCTLRPDAAGQMDLYNFALPSMMTVCAHNVGSELKQLAA